VAVSVTAAFAPANNTALADMHAAASAATAVATCWFASSWLLFCAE
jgi:hypothetical protein